MRKPEGKREHLEEPDIDVRMILKLIFRNRSDSVKCIDLAQERDRFQALVNAVMNCLVT